MVDGVPVILSAPGSVEPLNVPLIDPLDAPIDRLIAALEHQPPESTVASVYGRLSRYAWVGFHDWMPERWQAPGCPPPLASEVMKWLDREADENARAKGGVRAIVGAALGREAWAVDEGETLLFDAHLPSLLAAQRLARDGSLELPIATDSVHWERVCVSAPSPRKGRTAMVCGDVHDPPFEAEVFRSVIALNLIDSVRDPYTMFGQSHALVAPGGLLTVGSPFTWRTSITQQSRWLESMGSASDSAEDVLMKLSVELDPPLELRCRDRRSWWLRVTDHETICYQNVMLCFERPHNTE